jgi:hypothetical protein
VAALNTCGGRYHGTLTYQSYATALAQPFWKNSKVWVGSFLAYGNTSLLHVACHITAGQPLAKRIKAPESYGCAYHLPYQSKPRYNCIDRRRVCHSGIEGVEMCEVHCVSDVDWSDSGATLTR